jgi:hypothetical protein
MEQAKLLRLADFLDDLLPEQFNLHSWVTKGNPLEHRCGAICCAVGWACLLFKDEGLTLRDKGPSWRASARFVPILAGQPDGDVAWAWENVEQFFNITEEQAGHLFAEDSYPDGAATHPKEVATRIRNFVAGDE